MSKNILMLDIETLGTRTNAIVWQLALVGAPAADLSEKIDPPVYSFLPVEPQQMLIPPRKMDFSTFLFWNRQGEDARSKFNECDSESFEDLQSLLRHFIRGFERMTKNVDDYELVTKGNFDLPILQSLLEQCGFVIPWDFRKTVDLRTVMTLAGLGKRDTAMPQGMIEHSAYWDCIHQFNQYAEAIKMLRSA